MQKSHINSNFIELNIENVKKYMIHGDKGGDFSGIGKFQRIHQRIIYE